MNSEIAELVASVDGFPADETSKEALQTANLYLEMPVHAKSAEMETILNEAHDGIMTESITIDEGIAQMNEKIGALLAE